jgi:hypothetical protein
MLSLAIEFQGEVHYQTTSIFGSAAARQRKDQLKRKFAEKMGITVVSIPFWWDKTVDSLMATIHAHRFDIESPNLKAEPIPEEMPKRTLQRFKYQYYSNVPQELPENVNITGW